MESPSSAIVAGDGCDARNEEVASSLEQKTEVLSPYHAMANGSRDYRLMKNGKPRPSAVRDFPKNIIPANKIFKSSEEMKHADVLPVPSKDKEEQKQIKEGLIAPETGKLDVNADVDKGKIEKGSSKKLRPDLKPGKASVVSLKKPEEESKKQGLASPEMAKSIKEMDASTMKSQKMPIKLADKKASTISSKVAEAGPNKGKDAPLEKMLKTPTQAGKSIEKKASAIASTASEKEAKLKAGKGKDVLLDKAEKTKAGKSVAKKPSGIASTVSDGALKDVDDERNKEKVEKIQKMPTKSGNEIEKNVKDIASSALDISKGAEQEVVNASQGEIEAMDIDKEELCAEIEQDKQKEEKSQEETKREKIKKLHPVKKKPGIRDLPEIAKPAREKVAVESVPDHVVQDLDMKGGVQDESAVDKAELDSNRKKKRPLAEPDSSNRSKKVSKLKASDVAQAAKESNSPVATPKARTPAKKSSTPSESGKKVRRSVGKSTKPTTVTDIVEARKLVLESLRLFDAVRRKFVRDEEKTVKTKGARADLQAATFLNKKNVGRVGEKAHGSFPGLFVGDIFLFRTELSFARVHGPIQAGIEYLTVKESEYDTPIAISIVSNVGQDGEDNGEELIYTGQGGRSADNKQIADQKLERGNLALDGNKKFNVPVRMIRGIKDVNSPSGKVYVYDGLYIVEDMYTEKGSGGFNEFKFKLKRMPGQPELGSEILSQANELKSQAPSARKDVVDADISKGKESPAICVENTVDDEKVPASFVYATKVIYPDDMEKLEPSTGCNCKGACSLSNSCSCYCQNGDDLPFLNGGYLVRQKDYVFECGSKCSCSSSCRNRATERGLKIRLDVFKTADRGWGVRSLDIIPAGRFVCEYVGKILRDEEEIKSLSDRKHMLLTRRLPDTTPRWGDEPSIIQGRSSSTSRPDARNPELIIDASSVGNVARFINHSCSPNLLMQKVLSDHQDVRYPQFKLFAMDNIPPLRELTFDYGHPTDQEQVLDELSMDCLCGSSECRGKLYL